MQYSLFLHIDFNVGSCVDFFCIMSKYLLKTTKYNKKSTLLVIKLVDFKKLLGNEEIAPETDPISIFDYLDKESIIEGLRDSQKHILNMWHEDFRD